MRPSSVSVCGSFPWELRCRLQVPRFDAAGLTQHDFLQQRGQGQHSWHGVVPANSTKGNLNMIAKLNTEDNEIRALPPGEFDAVSGGAVIKLFDFKVAGMHVVGVANTETGDSASWVRTGDSLYINGKKV